MSQTGESRNFSLTMNNPTMPMEEWFALLKRDALYARVQLEKGEEGTPHFQACVGYKSNRKLQAMIKKFKGCHIEKARNAFATWEYCGKTDSREEGPLDHGIPPASKNIKGDTKKRNQMILEYGVAKAVEEGLIPIEKYKQVKQSVDLFKLDKYEQYTP